MAKRATPLYEMMVRRPDAAPARPAHAPDEAGAEGGELLQGRMLRIPVGYALVALAVVVGLLIGSYMFGAVRGAKAKEAEYEGIMAAGVGEAVAGRARDPLLTPSDVERGGAGATGAPAEAPRRPPAGQGDLESDPREAGLFYYVLAETQRTGAVRLAEFCRANGLAAHVVPGNNSRLRRVIVLPGVPTRSKTDPAAQTLLRDVYRVGKAWKAKYPGESDLSDAYPIR